LVDGTILHCEDSSLVKKLASKKTKFVFAGPSEDSLFGDNKCRYNAGFYLLAQLRSSLASLFGKNISIIQQQDLTHPKLIFF
jgi:hypothetical protein